MKQLLSYITMLTCLSVNAKTLEFKVDCGNDTVFCYNMYNDTSYHLGTQVKLFNGEAPFTYKWSCRYVIDSTIIFTASDILNDTNIANPYFKDVPLNNNRLIFYLNIKDKNNNIAIDSLVVRFSWFSYSSDYIQFELNAGDSIQLNDAVVGGGIPPLKYFWTPGTFLFDSTDINTWCKPKETIDYYQYAIDSAGCKSYPNMSYRIVVLPTLIKSVNHNNTVDVHQNGNKIFFNNPQNRLAIIAVFTLDGKFVYESKTKDSFIEIGNSLSQNGIYIYILKVQNEFVSGKYINYKVIQK